MRRTSFRRRAWLPATEEAKLEHVSFHAFRHSHVAMLIERGEHPRTIASRVGHSSTWAVLDLDGHLLPGVDEAAADRLDQLVTEGLGADPGQISQGSSRTATSSG